PMPKQSSTPNVLTIVLILFSSRTLERNHTALLPKGRVDATNASVWRANAALSGANAPKPQVRCAVVYVSRRTVRLGPSLLAHGSGRPRRARCRLRLGSPRTSARRDGLSRRSRRQRPTGHRASRRRARHRDTYRGSGRWRVALHGRKLRRR